MGRGSAQGRHDRDEKGVAVKVIWREEKRRSSRERKVDPGWYITSKLVQLANDQIASRVINRSRVAFSFKKFTTPRVIIISSLSTNSLFSHCRYLANAGTGAFEPDEGR